MPGISSSTDSNYNYYRQRVTDLEDQLGEDRKNAEEARKRELASLQERQKAELERKDRQTEETIRNVRENASTSLERERENAKRDRDEILKTTYNKVGRYGGLDPFALKEQVKNLKEENDIRDVEHERSVKLTEEDYHKKLEESERRYNERLERTSDEAKSAAARSYSKTHREQEKDYAQLRDESQEKYDELVRQMNTERVENAKRLNSIVEEYERKEKKTDDQKSNSSEKLEASYQKKLEDTVLIANRTAAEANQRSQESVRKMQDHLALYGKEAGKGTAEALDRFEHENKVRLEKMQDIHEKELDKIRSANEAALRRNETTHAETMADKDLYMTNVTRRMADDAHRDRKELSDTHERATNTIQRQHDHDKEVAQRSHDNQLRIQNEQHASALEEQGRAFQRTLSHNQEFHDAEVSRLQERLTLQQTTSDPNQVPIGAYEKIRKSVGKEFTKQLDAEQERNKRSVETLQEGNLQKYSDLRREKEQNETGIRMEAALERHLDRKSMLAHIEDTEFQKQEALRKKEYDTYRETQNLNRSYATSLEKQRASLDEVINLQRNDAAFKLQSQRQDAEFEQRRAHREFAARESELIRNHEDKLQTAKNELTARMEETKLQGQVAVRDAEQRGKQLLEEQARSYEQKIARMEEQHKEHERYLKDNFNEQLEKLKRSYDLNNKKKS